MDRHFDANKDEWVVTDSQGTEIYRVPADVAKQVATMLQGDTPCLASALEQKEPSRGPFPTQDWIKRERPGVSTSPKTRSVILSNGRIVIEPIDSSEAERHAVATEEEMGKHHQQKMTPHVSAGNVTDAPPSTLKETIPESEGVEIDLSEVGGAPIGSVLKLLQPDESCKKGTTYAYGCSDVFDYYDNWE